MTKEIEKRDVFSEVEIKKMFVIIEVYKRGIEQVRVTDSEEKATEIEKELCDDLSVPFEEEEREKYYWQF
ncbi:hypothetical protein AKJ40_03320 [candidate division MSBL1 archaeon SCGC-AAA259M10]|uniref:Uncharacterized protein n=1 Tax=candidate division MSBL1 archaeon SCGC-AAA259M10 TaxID=1698270 RepID=A0A133UYW4_9EURY|nr:hypothetical protein AKJ40_03320 [candidate division MSBL1 archaeon SCGC-AAA259M10]